MGFTDNIKRNTIHTDAKKQNEQTKKKMLNYDRVNQPERHNIRQLLLPEGFRRLNRPWRLNKSPCCDETLSRKIKAPRRFTATGSTLLTATHTSHVLTHVLLDHFHVFNQSNHTNKHTCITHQHQIYQGFNLKSSYLLLFILIISFLLLSTASVLDLHTNLYFIPFPLSGHL